MKTKVKLQAGFTPQIRSRHPSHRVLRGTFGKFPVRSVVRLGSTTELLNDGKRRIEINTPKAIGNSASKLKMKQCFSIAGVKTANWYYTWLPKFKDGHNNGIQFMMTKLDKTGETTITPHSINELPFPIVAKSLFGSRGRGNTKLDTKEQLASWLKGKDTSGYIFEEYFDGVREYRFHISTLGVFLTWRKLRRNDTPQNERWFFNNHNCNWVSENHELYNKPSTYKQIGDECVKALKAVGLDIGGCDVRVNKDGKFVIIEINSACSLAEVTATAYKNELAKLINKKINE